MRLIKNLIKDTPSVWIYCENEAFQKHFLKQAEVEGFQTINGQKPSELFHHQLYGIDHNLNVGYLAAMIWCLTFRTGNDEQVRVDYGKYISGEKDYICHSTKLKRIDYGDWNQIAYSNGYDSETFATFCEKFIEGQSFEEYCAYIYRYLIESNWHYTPEQSVERIQSEDYYIVECYIKKISASYCASEVGFGCG